MEMCGGQTHAILRFGLDEMLPREITLIHGPGCPVCVTPIELIDKAVAIAARPEVIFCSFGDMLRVPGSQKDLFTVKSAGGDVRVVYSPMDAVALAGNIPTARWCSLPSASKPLPRPTPWPWRRRQSSGWRTSPMLVSHVLVPPAIWAVLDSPSNRVQGFWPPGTSARSRAWLNTGRLPRNIACRSWSPASSRSISCRAS